MLRRVIVTGMGQLSAVGQGIECLKEALLLGRSCFSKSHQFPELLFPVVAALLSDFQFDLALSLLSGLPSELLLAAKKAGHRAPLTIQATLIAALEAWQKAKLPLRSLEKMRVGLVVAGHNTTRAYQALHTEKPLHYLTPSYALRFQDADQVGTLSEVFNIRDLGFTVGATSASGNVAIMQAFRMIQQNLLDICLVVGTLADLSSLELQGFHSIGALGGRQFANQPDQACRPFDAAREGFIWGQGSGCLVLESELVVKSHGVTALAEIKAVSMALDANRSANPNHEGQMLAMKKALSEARLVPQEIGYVNAHGTSSVLGDQTEIDALQLVFGEAKEVPCVNSTKSIIGHCLWSAGIMEVIATILQMQQGFLHANLNLETPMASICHLLKSMQLRAVQYALSNSFGFGGINTSVVVAHKG